MKCDFERCIYNRASGCTAGEIGITCMGMCDSCIVLSLDTEFIKREKDRQRQEVEDRETKTEK